MERARFMTEPNVPVKADGHCEERSDEAIPLDRHGALRAPRDDKSLNAEGRGHAPLRCGLILLAAGESRRMGRPKQLLPVGGQPLLRHVVASLLSAPVAPFVVVLGSQATELAPVLADLPVQIVINPEWAEGIFRKQRSGPSPAGC